MTTKHEIIQASKLYFKKKFGKIEFVPGKTYITPSDKVLVGNDCKNLIDAFT
jgi:hypothetical protein